MQSTRRTLIYVATELITFQTERAKLMSGTLTRVSSSSISTAEDQIKNQTNATEKIHIRYKKLINKLTISINLRERL